MGVGSVPVATPLSHADTLEISCHSPTRVLMLALEFTEGKRHTSYRSYSTIIYIQNYWCTALFWKTARTQIILSPETPWTLYNYIYFWKITPQMVPNIDGTIGHKRKKHRKHQIHWTQCVIQYQTNRKHQIHWAQCVIQYQTNRKPAQSLQENAVTIFGPRLYNSLPKYLRDIESVKTV